MVLFVTEGTIRIQGPHFVLRGHRCKYQGSKRYSFRLNWRAAFGPTFLKSHEKIYYLSLYEDNPISHTLKKKENSPVCCLYQNFLCLTSEDVFSILKTDGMYFHGSAFDFKVGVKKIALSYLS